MRKPPAPRSNGWKVSTYDDDDDDDATLKRKREHPLDESTLERAETVLQEVKQDYAKKMLDLGKAYKAAVDRTKSDCWKRLTERMGIGLMEALEVDFDIFFTSSNVRNATSFARTTTASPPQENGFALLPRRRKRRKFQQQRRRSNGLREDFSSGDDADVESDDDESDLKHERATLRALTLAPTGTLVRYIYNNQYTTKGGRSACTAIAFAAAYRMSLTPKVESLERKVDWGAVLVLGSKMWNLWKDGHRGGGESARRFISVEDIRSMPFTKRVFGKVWDTLDSTETEKVGYIDDRVNAGLDDGEKHGTATTNLKDALKSMKVGRAPTTAVICAGSYQGCNSSVALWKNASGNYAMYDSHGGKMEARSTLYLMRDLEAAVAQIREVLSGMPKTRLDRPIAGVSECVLYSMHILRFEFTNTEDVV